MSEDNIYLRQNTLVTANHLGTDRKDSAQKSECITSGYGQMTIHLLETSILLAGVSLSIGDPYNSH